MKAGALLASLLVLFPMAQPAAADGPRRVALVVPGPDLDDDALRMQRSLASMLEAQGVRPVVVTSFPAGPRQPDIDRTLSSVLAAGPDLVCVTGRVNIASAVRLSKSTPVVFYNADDPVRDGLVASVREPGGNATGVATRISQLHEKRIELFRAMRQDASRVALLFPEEVRDGPVIANFRRVLASHGLQAVEVVGPEKLDRAGVVEAIKRAKADAFVSVGFERTTSYWVSMQFDAGTPGLFQNAQIARTGGLLANGPDFPEMERRVAVMAAKVLKGTRPGAIPVDELARPYVVINLETARRFGIQVPESLLLRADEVVR